MVLLVKIQESAIVENLKKRFFDDLIYVSSVINLILLHGMGVDREVFVSRPEMKARVFPFVWIFMKLLDLRNLNSYYQWDINIDKCFTQ